MDSCSLNYSTGMSSPVLQVEQIYKLAGWTSPQQSNEKDEENDEISPTSSKFPPTFIKLTDDLKYKPIDDNDDEELPIIISELKEINLNSSTQSLPSTTTSITHKPTSTSNPPPTTSTATASTVVLSELPVSFEQIYDLSNRNRKRLKDKQKGAGNTELDDSGHCSIPNTSTTAAVTDTNTALLSNQLIDSYDDKVGVQGDGQNSDPYSSFDENLYFNAKPNDDKEDHILHVVITY